MNLYNITNENYNTIVEWYKGWDLPITPFECIPRNSLIVDNVCAGFIYQLDNTPMWWIEGVISNPKVEDKKLKKESLKILIKSLEDVAVQNGGSLIMSSTPRESLNMIFLDAGYKNPPEKYFHVARFI